MSVKGASQTITAEVTSWEGIVTRPHRFGGKEFNLDARREIGHIHGDAMVDVPLSMRLRDQLVAEGRASPHHIYPQTGNVTIYLNQPEDVQRAIEVLRLSYELAVKQREQSKAKL
jgi:hypothetical protein